MSIASKITLVVSNVIGNRLNWASAVLHLIRAAERGGAGGYNDPGAHGLEEGRLLQRAKQRADELERGPIKMTLRNQHVKPEDLFFFFFGDHLISIGNTVRISVKNFFFFWRSPNFDRKDR